MTLNWIGVFVAAAVGMAIGFAWYSPVLFAKPWARLSGIDCSKMGAGQKKGMGLVFAAAFVVCLAMAAAIEFIIWRMGLWTLSGALRLGFLLWAGFIAPVMLSSVLWEKKPLALYLINAGHYLVVVEVMAAILLIL